MSDEKAARKRSCGDGVLRSAGAAAGSRVTPASGSLGGGDGSGCAPMGALAAGSAPPRPSVSVLRNSAASGPSRMLARLWLAIRQNLLRQLAIGVGRRALRVVLEHRHPLHGGLREPDGLPDARREHPVPEVLLEDLDRLLGMDGP